MESIKICSCFVIVHEDGFVEKHDDPHCRVHGDGTTRVLVTDFETIKRIDAEN
jgi:hypothetical protein